jgi:hypothetical protein
MKNHNILLRTSRNILIQFSHYKIRVVCKYAKIGNKPINVSWTRNIGSFPHERKSDNAIWNLHIAPSRTISLSDPFCIKLTNLVHPSNAYLDS